MGNVLALSGVPLFVCGKCCV